MRDNKWGSPRNHQVTAEGEYRHNWEEDKLEVRWLGILIEPARREWRSEWRSVKAGDDAPDEARLKRQFVHRCGLIKAINVLSPKLSSVTLYLEGRPNMHVGLEMTEFVVDPAEDERLVDGPIAEIHFKGEGTRWGELEHGHITKVRLLFADRVQLEQSVVATVAAPDAETRTSYYTSSASSSSGGSSLWPLAAGFALGTLLSD